MVLAEEKLAIEVAQINGVQVNLAPFELLHTLGRPRSTYHLDVMESRERHVLQQLTANPSRPHHQHFGRVNVPQKTLTQDGLIVVD